MIDYRHPRRTVVIRLNKGDSVTLSTRPMVTRAARLGPVEVQWTPRSR